MKSGHPRWRRRLLAAVGALALFATACGGQSAEQAAAAEAAEANVSQVQISSDLSATELLDTRDGSVTSLDDVVTGDRAVLLWYWAPH